MKRIIAPITAAALTLACLAQAQQPEIKPTQKTTFDAVTAKLNPGGDFYMYISAEGWFATMLSYADGLEKMALQNAAEADEKEKITRGFALIRKLVTDAGLTRLSGLGLSSIAIDDGIFRNRAVAYHKPGEGIAWPMLGTKPRTLPLQMLPPDTVAAFYGDLDARLIWNYLVTTLRDSGIPEAAEGLEEMHKKLAEQRIDLDALLDSLSGEVAIALTMSPEAKHPFTTPKGVTLQIPEASLLIAIKVKNSAIFDRVDRELAKMGPNLQRVDNDRLRQRTAPIPLPLPVKLAPTIAATPDYLLIATNADVVDAALAAAEGKGPSLTGLTEFKQCTRKLVPFGNNYHYISPRLAKALLDLMESVIEQDDNIDNAARAALKNIREGLGEGFWSCGVIANSDEGILFTGNSNFSVSKLAMLQGAVVPTSILAGMLLPALGQAREKARSVNCMGNLKQIGLGVILYADEANGKLPDDFQQLVEKGYLTDGAIWGCPGAKNPAKAAANSDYIYVGAGLKLGDVTNPTNTVIAYDKPGNHGRKMINVLFLDGHVQSVKATDIAAAAAANGWTIGVGIDPAAQEGFE